MTADPEAPASPWLWRGRARSGTTSSGSSATCPLSLSPSNSRLRPRRGPRPPSQIQGLDRRPQPRRARGRSIPPAVQEEGAGGDERGSEDFYVWVGCPDLRIRFRSGGLAGAARCLGRRLPLQGWSDPVLNDGQSGSDPSRKSVAEGVRKKFIEKAIMECEDEEDECSSDD